MRKALCLGLSFLPVLPAMGLVGLLDGPAFSAEIEESDLLASDDESPSRSKSFRQWLQIQGEKLLGDSSREAAEEADSEDQDTEAQVNSNELRRRQEQKRLDIIYKVRNIGFRLPKNFDEEVFASAVLEAEALYEIPSDLLVGVSIVESHFRPDAVSSMNARGIFQLLPTTADYIWPSVKRRLQSKDPLRRYPKVSHRLHEIRLSTLLGAAYLSYLREKFEGRIHLAIASYNVGPATLEKGLKLGRLPGAEYVFRVFAATKTFRELKLPRQEIVQDEKPANNESVASTDS